MARRTWLEEQDSTKSSWLEIQSFSFFWRFVAYSIKRKRSKGDCTETLSKGIVSLLGSRLDPASSNVEFFWPSCHLSCYMRHFLVRANTDTQSADDFAV